jgi:hypothetical protein
MTTNRHDDMQTELTAEEQRLSALLDEALRPGAFDDVMPLDLSRRITAATTPLLGIKRPADDMDGPVPDREADAPVIADVDAPAVIGRIRPAHWFGGLIAAGLAAAVLLMVYAPDDSTPTILDPVAGDTPIVAALTEAELDAKLAHVQQFAQVDTRSAPIDDALEVLAIDLDSASRESSWLEDNATFNDDLTDWMDDYNWPEDSLF